MDNSSSPNTQSQCSARLASTSAATPTANNPSCGQGTRAPRSAGAAPRNSSKAASTNSNAWAENNQNTPRQLPLPANAPPSKGPSTVASAQIAVAEANTRAKCRSGKNRDTATMAKPEIQPPPTPCTQRPARKVKISGASADTAHPVANTSPAPALARAKPYRSANRPALATARIVPIMNSATAQLKYA